MRATGSGDPIGVYVFMRTRQSAAGRCEIRRSGSNRIGSIRALKPILHASLVGQDK